MNELQTFTYNNAQVRTVEKNGEPWFVLKDVCDVLGISKYRDMASKLDEDERVSMGVDTPGGKQEMTVINESGLYFMIFHSNKPEAKPFRKWVTAEVLPSIRKTGSYSVKSEQPALETSERDLPKAEKSKRALAIKEMNAKVRLSNQFLKLAKIETLSTECKNILLEKAAEVLSGTELTPQPNFDQKTYSAAEVGKMFGVTAQKIGRISNEHNLKTSEYGAWYRSKSEYSDREVDTFRYNDKAIEKFRTILLFRQMMG